MTNLENPLIELPVKLLFSDMGVDFFIKNKKPMNKFKMPDNSTQYGIALNKYNSKAVKQMIGIGYISRIEISRAEFSSKRKDILAMSESNVFGFFVKRFDELIFEMVIDSNLIKSWNRTNHGSILDRKTNINEKVLKQILEKNKDVVKGIRETLALAANNYLYSNKSLSEDEITTQGLLCNEYLNNIRSFTWFILIKFKDNPNYELLIMDISRVLVEFMSRNNISEYLSLMLMELVNSAENRNMKEYIKGTYPNISYNSVLEVPESRIKILNEMEEKGIHFSVGFKFDKSETKVSHKRKFEVAVFNKESEDMMLKEKVDKQMASKVLKQSLTDFYKRSGSDGSDLGMFYLSYLGEECSKVGIKFESQVKDIFGSGQSYTSLSLTL